MSMWTRGENVPFSSLLWAKGSRAQGLDLAKLYPITLCFKYFTQGFEHIDFYLSDVLHKDKMEPERRLHIKQQNSWY